MSLLDRIDIEVNRTRERLARLQQIRELVVELDGPVTQNGQADASDSSPSDEGAKSEADDRVAKAEQARAKLQRAVAVAKSPPPSSEGGTLDGRIIEALQYKPQGAFSVADRLQEDREAVKARLEVLIAEGHIERGRGGVYRCL